MDFKNIHEIPHMNHRDRNYLIIFRLVFNTESHFDDPGRPKMVFYIRDNIESRIKCVVTGDHAYAFRDGSEVFSVNLVLLNYGLRLRVDYITLGSIRFCRRLWSSDSLYYAVTLMFRDMGLKGLCKSGCYHRSPSSYLS
ncbi:BnaC03g77350D [Brassica napus]|uniref:BnaC03g77350D protein n=1 Tax=Brassica napus TaxID=3708 RepID=A0A078IQ06_BRANA|nr:BnaC03g77350D [Brassica napus]